METPLQSAVRLPTPDSDEAQSPPAKRKRLSSSRSPPPPRRPPMLRDVEPDRAAERERQLAERQRQQENEETTKPLTDAEKQAAAKAEYERLLQSRGGGTYIPPARLRALQAQIGSDTSSKEYQRMAWEALKKSLNGLINKVNIANIKPISLEIFNENLIRGRGLLCRSLMKAQAASLPFTPIYAALVAVVNTKLPQIGELLINRLVVQFRKAYKRNDKAVCLSATTFIAQLCNQQVVSEMLPASLLLILLQTPTDDSVEIAVGLMREVGAHMEEMNGQIALLVFDQFRSILHEADIDKRVQYMIEVLFQVRKDRYKDNPAIKDELDLVEEEDQITHQSPDLDGPLDVLDSLNVFKFDTEYDEHEEAYKKLKAEILGEADESDEDDDDDDDSDDSSEDGEEAEQEKAMEIQDRSNQDLTALRRTIYLTINSSADFEEAVHKLMKINLPVGLESELPSMIIETCSQRPTYEKFYGSMGERLARLNRLWTEQFEAQFVKYYDTIHRYETNRLRNIARFFGQVMSSEPPAIGWHVWSCVRLNEEDTTSSSRIFIKILFQSIVEDLGMAKMRERLRDPALAASFEGIFPTDNPRNTRFSINYFTSIGLGAVTEDMREFLKNMPKPVIPALPAANSRNVDDSASDSGSSYSSYSSYSGSSRSRSHSRSRTPPPRSSRSTRPTRGRSPSVEHERFRSRSRSPPPRRTEIRDRAPVRRRRSYSSSYSRSRSRERNQNEAAGSETPPASNRRRRYSRSLSWSRTPPSRINRAVRRNSSSGNRSRSRSPYTVARAGTDRRTGDAQRRARSRSPREPTKSAPAPRERSLSPYSQRVALTRQARGQGEGRPADGGTGSTGRGGRAKAGDFM